MKKAEKKKNQIVPINNHINKTGQNIIQANKIIEAVKSVNATLISVCGMRDGTCLADVKSEIVYNSKGGVETVRVTYDGAGFDYWTYDSVFSSRVRFLFTNKLEAINPEFFFEDCNSWSLVISS